MQFNLENLQALIVQYGTQIIGALLVLVIGWWIIGGIARSVNKVLTARNIDATSVIAGTLMPLCVRFWYLC